MLKIYEENDEFNRWTKFDTLTGKLQAIDEMEFLSYLPEGFARNQKAMQRLVTPDATIFLGETPTTRTRFPRRVYFQITRNCNLNCRSCFIKAKSDGSHVPTSSIFRIAEFLGYFGLMEVRLTGGEPTTHPDFFEIIEKFQQEGVYVSIGTNGFFNDKIRERLCKLKNIWLICSIDGNKETHNSFRPATFDRILKNMEYIKNQNPGLRLRLNTILSKKNKDQIFDLGVIAKSLDAESITLIPLRPQVRDKSILNDMVSPAEFIGVLEEMKRTTEKLGVKFTTTIETEFKKHILPDPVFTKRSSCAAGREGTNLDYDMVKEEFFLYGCSYSPASDFSANAVIRKPFVAGSFPIGQISKFIDIWRDDNSWTIYRDLSLKPFECQICDYKSLNMCTGSCPIQNIDYTDLRLDSDVLEQLEMQLWQTCEWYCYKNFL